MRAHLSINVRDLEKSVQFYQRIFGVQPQKQAAGYAKFDLKNPSFNFSMHEISEGRLASRLNHLGIEVETSEEVQSWKKRLEEIGVTPRPEENTDCCFARQDKVWFEDPDGNAWEVFFVHEQLPITGAEPPKKTMCGAGTKGAGTGCC